jgi:hypothetical protein
MNKTLTIVIGIVAVLALLVGLAAVIYLWQGRTAANQSAPALFENGRMGFGMMGSTDGRGVRGRGDTDQSNMQTYMLQSLVKQLGTTEADLTTQLNQGKSLLDLAAAKDMSVKEYQAMLTQAQTAAIDQALANGEISQNAADSLKSNTGGLFLRGFGMGACW